MRDEYMDGHLVVKKILKECKKRKISFYELAKKSGINQSTMSMLINNPDPNPTIKTIGKFCKALNITLGDFFSDLMFFEK